MSRVQPRSVRLRLIWITAALLLVGAAAVLWLNVRGDPPIDHIPSPGGAQAIERGAYLARAGNCMGCHTSAGGAAYAGGRGIDTPFGTVYAGNLTADPDTGIGR